VGDYGSIGTSETCGTDARRSARGGNPDIERTSRKDRVWTRSSQSSVTRPRSRAPLKVAPFHSTLESEDTPGHGRSNSRNAIFLSQIRGRHSANQP